MSYIRQYLKIYGLNYKTIFNNDTIKKTCQMSIKLNLSGSKYIAHLLVHHPHFLLNHQYFIL
jgi:hypothetical protein